MNLYFAPLEGVTDVNLRNIHARIFDTPTSRPDKYFAPFLALNQDLSLHERDKLALAKESNPGITVVPQIMTNRTDIFLAGARALFDMGYDEINFNLGCPSGTVVGKKRGAGFLSELDALDLFFDTVFSDALFARDEMHLSVKTRLGMFSPEEFEDILPIYNRYPISELILHPRVRREMYKGEVHTEYSVYTMENSPLPFCVNGDLFCVDDVRALLARLPKEPSALMLGRGAVSNPYLFAQIRALLSGKAIPPLTKETLSKWISALYDDTTSRLSGERHMLFRLKELWAYWIVLFEGAEPYRKCLRKTNTLSEFVSITESLLANLALIPGAGFLGNAKMNTPIT